MKIDMHLHTVYSGDSTVTLKEIEQWVKRRGLDGVAITDHNRIKGALKIKNALSSKMLIIPGLEITTNAGHVLAYGISEVVPRGLSIAETIEKIKEQGGVSVAPHPHRFYTGIGADATLANKFDGVEVVNGASRREDNRRARELAERMHVGMTGGSDAHLPEYIGKGWTLFEEGDVDDCLAQIERSTTAAYGDGRTFSETVRYVTRAVSLWLKRGMRRI